MSPRGCTESLWVCEGGGVCTSSAGVHVTCMVGTRVCRNVYMRACMGSIAVTSADNDIPSSRPRDLTCVSHGYCITGNSLPMSP